MGDLVMRTRVLVTRRNLRRIQEFTKIIDHHEAWLGEFLSLPDQVAKEIDGLWRQVYALKPRVARLQDDDRNYDEPDVNADEEDGDIYDDLTKVEARLNGLKKELKRHSDQARRLRQQAGRLMGPRNDVRDFLLRAAEQLEPTLTTQNYLSERTRVDALFSDYVELLRGIALRQAAFGDEANQLRDLFLIADELPRLWSPRGWTWQSLAVPSLQERKPSEVSVLRIGFPEWTVWALPFVHNSFAHVFIQKQRLRSTDGGDEDNALADALATVVTGPAYACAALLLRLDPASVDGPLSETTLRSATVLATLYRVAGTVPDSPVKLLVDRLCEEWRDAVKAAGGDADAFGSALKSESVAEVVAVAFNECLPRAENGFEPPLWASHWSMVSRWAKLLREQSKIRLAELAVEADGRPVALALLLDAAWLARVGIRAEEDAPLDQLDGIAKEAVSLMLDVITPGHSPGTTSRRNR